MEHLELDIFQQESSLISKLKEQVSLLKTALRDKEHENANLRAQLISCQENFEAQGLAIGSKDKMVEELRSLTEKLLALNSNLQVNFEKGEADKLDLAEKFEEANELSARQFQAFSIQVSELKETCANLIKDKEVSSARLEENLHAKQQENEFMKKEVEEITKRFTLAQSELEQRLRIELENHSAVIAAKNEALARCQQSIESCKQEAFVKDLKIAELETLLKNTTSIDSVIKNKEAAIEKLRADFELQLASIKSQMNADAAKHESFKSELKHKYKKKLMTLNEQHEEQLITLTADYKQECIALRTDNKQLFEENTALKSDLNSYKDKTGRLINDKDEVIFVTQKSAKQERRKLEERISELENHIHILAAEKADFLSDFDNFQHQINQLTSVKFQLLKENKLLINKLVNLTEYPSLRPVNKLSRSLSPQHLVRDNDGDIIAKKNSRLDKANAKFDGNRFKTDRSEVIDDHKTNIKSNIKNPNADDDLSIRQSFLKNFSLTPKFLDKRVNNVQNESRAKKESLYKTENLNRVAKATTSPHQETESLSALEMIKDLRKRNSIFESELRRKEEEINELETTIASMQSQMKEIGLLSTQRMDEVKSLSDQNQSLLTKIERLNAQVRSSTAECQNLQSQLSDKERDISAMSNRIAFLEQVN
jgi:chromosome segregation ATPase